MKKLSKSPRKVHGAEMYALQPNITAQEIATKLGVSPKTVEAWRQDPNFIDAIYNRYMIEFGGEIPAVLNAMIREAKSGNVQAGRLILEHSGKLVKNVNITIDSPFEKFMSKIEVANVEEGEIEDAEVEEIISTLPDITESLPARNFEDQSKRITTEKRVIKKAIKTEKQKSHYLDQRREWYRWKKRAEEVNVAPLPSKRPTKGQRKAWIDEIVRRESEKKDD